MRAGRLALALLVPVVTIPTLLAQPASAHTLTGVQPTNYRSEIVSVEPRGSGITVEILDLGRRIRLSNPTDTDVVVAGYQGEPYLRVGRRGVFENVHSPAVYINLPSPGYATTSTTLPPIADPVAAPTWRRVARGSTATWRDHRTRWEGADPASVRRAPGQRQVVRPWLITFTRAGQSGAVTGRLVWVPGPTAVPWFVLAAIFAMATFAACFTQRWATLLAIALGTLIVNDIVHSFAAAWATHDGVGAVVFRVVVIGFYGTIAWVVGALGIRPLSRGRDLGALLAGITGFFLALLGGATDATSLGRSQLGFALPAAVARFEVALSLGLGIGLVAATAWLFFASGDLLLRSQNDPAT